MTRNRCVLASLVVTCALLLAACMSGDEQAAFNALNGDRTSRGIPALAENASLTVKAQNWAQNLLNGSGNQCSGAALRHSNLADGAPAGWRGLAENVGCEVTANPSNSPASLERNFMASSGHAANILNRSYNYGGIGMVSRQLSNGLWLVFEAQEFAAI